MRSLVVAIASLVIPALSQAAVDISLNVLPTNPDTPGAGGQWSVVARTDDAD